MQQLVKIRHGLAYSNSNNSVVYGQKHKVWVVVFPSLERVEYFETKIERSWLNFLFCNKTVPSSATTCKERC